MCGIIGLYHPTENVSGEIYDALIQVQHRGQDAAGIATWDTKKLSLHKELGVVTEAVSYTHLTLPTSDLV